MSLTTVDTSPGLDSAPRTRLALRPVLDVVARSAAGFEASAGADVSAGDAVTAALRTRTSLPPNTFLTIAPDHAALSDPGWLVAATDHGGLSGVIVHVDEPQGLDAAARDHLRVVRDAGALLSVGDRHHGQPSLSTIVDLRPAVVRLGRAWVRGCDVDTDKRRAIARTGDLAAQLDAWILADDVRTASELAVLGELEVPLAQGPLIGTGTWPWSGVTREAHRALNRVHDDRGPRESLRGLLQRACTTPDALPTVGAALRDGYDLTVVIDDRGRPVSLLVLRGDEWVAERPFTINVDTAPGRALERARHRPHDRRDAPLVCTDAAGRFCGVLRLDRLALHVEASRS